MEICVPFSAFFLYGISFLLFLSRRRADFRHNGEKAGQGKKKENFTGEKDAGMV